MIGEDQAVQFLRSRRSIRAYKDTPVEKEKIERLIEIGRYGPYGSNTQLVEWLVFNDKAKIKTLAGIAVDWMRHVLNENQQSAPLFPYLPWSLSPGIPDLTQYSGKPSARCSHGP